MRKKSLTRKGKALRWLLAAVVLGALAWVLLPWNFTAEAAHHQRLRQNYAADTTIVYEDTSLFDRTLLFSLNDHVIGMGVYERHLLFLWDGISSRVVERETDRPYAAGYFCEYEISHDLKESMDFYYVYGVIEDESLTEIQIDFVANVGGHDQSIRLTQSDWITTETGDVIFACTLEPEYGNLSRTLTVTGYRADGSSAATLWLTGPTRWED